MTQPAFPNTQAPAWDCPACGSTDNTLDFCPSCGTVRPATQASSRTASTPPHPPSQPAFETGSVFLFDPANRRFLDGEQAHPANLPKAHFVMVFVLGLMLLCSVIAISAAITAWNDYNRLRDEGVEINGQIVNKTISTDDDGDDTYYVHYRYEASGQEFTARESVSHPYYEEAQIGALVRVRYVPGKPQVAALAHQAADNGRQVFLTALAVILTVFTLLVAWGYIGQMDRRSRLLKGGQIIRAEVVGCRRSTSEDGPDTVHIRYRFVSPNGKPIKGQQYITLSNGVLPCEGDPLCIYYAADNAYLCL